MDKKSLKEKIDLVNELTKDLDDLIRAKAFEIILQNQLNEISTPDGAAAPGPSPLVEGDALGSLANACGTDSQTIQGVLIFDDNLVKLQTTFDEEKTVPKKQIKASQVILTAYLKGEGKDWITAKSVSKSLRENGISTINLGRAISSQKGKIFKEKGSGPGTEYGLTTPGWKDGIKFIQEKIQELNS